MAQASLKLVALVCFFIAASAVLASRETVQDNGITTNGACSLDTDCDPHCHYNCMSGFCGCGCSSPIKGVESAKAIQENGSCQTDSDCNSHCTHKCVSGGCFCQCTN